MKLSALLCLGAVCVVLFCPPTLLAQQEFQAAHEKITGFFLEAQPTRDPARREQISKDASALPGTVIPLITSGLLRNFNAKPAMSVDRMTLELAEALAAPTAPIMNASGAEGVASIVATRDSQLCAVAYDVSTCAACSTSWLGIFRRRRDKWVIAAHIVDPVTNDTVHAAWIGEGKPPLLLLYGIHWGDAHNRLDVRVYTLSSGTIREVSSLLDQPEGEIAIRNTKITISSDTALTSPRFRQQQTFVLSGTHLKLLHRTVSDTPE
jgi:hypothetical protein